MARPLTGGSPHRSATSATSAAWIPQDAVPVRCRCGTGAIARTLESAARRLLDHGHSLPGGWLTLTPHTLTLTRYRPVAARHSPAQPPPPPSPPELSFRIPGMTLRNRSLRTFTLLALTTVSLATVACGRQETASQTSAAPAAAAATEPAAAPAAPDQSYVFRGRVTGLPDPAAASRELSVAHEAIPAFAGPNGDVIGMDAMTMPFTLAQDLALTDIAVGDVVEMTLEVRWKASPPAVVTAVRELPADTQLTTEGAGGHEGHGADTTEGAAPGATDGGAAATH